MLLVGRINVIKMAILSKAMYRFNVTSIKTPWMFFTELRTNNSKIYMEPQKTLNCQSNPEKKRANL